VESKQRELMNRYITINSTWENIEADFAYYGPWEKQLNGGKEITTEKDNVKLVYKNPLVKIYKINK
jgi:hypothetical protein